jgi:hypothetical protein
MSLFSSHASPSDVVSHVTVAVAEYVGAVWLWNPQLRVAVAALASVVAPVPRAHALAAVTVVLWPGLMLSSPRTQIIATQPTSFHDAVPSFPLFPFPRCVFLCTCSSPPYVSCRVVVLPRLAVPPSARCVAVRGCCSSLMHRVLPVWLLSRLCGCCTSSLTSLPVGSPGSELTGSESRVTWVV